MGNSRNAVCDICRKRVSNYGDDTMHIKGNIVHTDCAWRVCRQLIKKSSMALSRGDKAILERIEEQLEE